MDAGQPVPSSYAMIRLPRHNRNFDAYFTAWNLPLPIRILFDILLSAASLMSRTHQLGVIFKARRDGFGAMRITFYEFDHFLDLLFFTPCLKLLQ